VSESKPSKPPPSDTELSEDTTDGGCRRLRPEAWDAPPATADATAVAASAAAITGDEGRAGREAACGNVRNTVVWSGASIDAAACFRLIACARRPRCFWAALAVTRTVGVGAPVTTLSDGPGESTEAAAASEGVAAAVTADFGVDAAASATAAEPGVANEATAAAECVTGAVAARPHVDAAPAATAVEPGAANKAAAAAECVAM